MFERDRQAETGRRPEDMAPRRYVMRERLISIGDDYWIETAAGQRAFYVDGKALSIRGTVILKAADGRELYEIQAKLLAIRHTMTIRQGERELASVKKALFSPLRDKMVANMADGPDIEIKGSILQHEYRMERSGKRIAEVSKRWIAIRDTYTVEVEPGEDDALILALAVVIERMTEDDDD